MKTFFSLTFLIIAVFSLNAFSQVEGDRIIAVVGNEIITESDFQYQVQLYARQNRLTEISPLIAQQIFQSILTNKIMLAKAEQDSIEATEDEIEKELESRMDNLIAQAGSPERLETVYGMPMAKIRNLLKEELRKNIKVEKLKREKFSGGIRVTDNEIKEFFKTYSDSLPEVSEEFELAHVFLERKVSESERAEGFKIANQLLDSIKQGVDFSELAMRYSADSGSARLGGDLGLTKKGTFVQPFEEAVYSLKPGEVSEVVETEFGLHIIKLTEKQGEKVRAQHILIPFPTFESSDFETINFLDSLKARIETGNLTFEEAAKQFSQDVVTKNKGGYLGKIPAEQIDSTSLEVIKATAKGGITKPIRSVGRDMKYGYEIYKIIEVIPPHKLSLEQDYDRIRKFAESFKENKEIENWINEIRKSIYVDIKM